MLNKLLFNIYKIYLTYISIMNNNIILFIHNIIIEAIITSDFLADKTKKIMIDIHSFELYLLEFKLLKFSK